MSLNTNRIRSFLLAGAVLSLPFMPAGAQATTLFASTQTGNSGDNFGTLDTTTGVFTGIANNFWMAGIAFDGTTLYGAAYAQVSSVGTLYSINTSTGAATPIGNSGVTSATGAPLGWIDFGATTAGLFGIAQDDKLYSINPATGAATLVGSTGQTFNLTVWSSLSNGLGGLFLDIQDSIYTIDTTTGAATFLGCTNSGGPQPCSGNQMGAMGAAGGTLYGIDSVIDELYTINTSTGKDTAIATITGNFSSNFFGLAGAPVSGGGGTAVPEPSSLAIITAGLLGLAGLRRRRKANPI